MKLVSNGYGVQAGVKHTEKILRDVVDHEERARNILRKVFRSVEVGEQVSGQQWCPGI